MFNGDNIRDEVFTNYYKLVTLFKTKGKLYPNDVNSIVPSIEYFSKNYDNFNIDELKVCKNAFIAVEGIKNKLIKGVSNEDISAANATGKLMDIYIDNYKEKQKESK